MFLVHPLPPHKVWVRKEYLRDHKDGHGELLEGYWVSVKSVPGKVLYFETFLPEIGALFDKLPISAFQWHNKKIKEPFGLKKLCKFDCFDYDITVIEKPLLGACKFRDNDGNWFYCDYVFTVDTCAASSKLDMFFSETDAEHKSMNVLAMENGQFAIQPNNKIIWTDKSLSPNEREEFTINVCTQNYSVDTDIVQGENLGDENKWNY